MSDIANDAKALAGQIKADARAKAREKQEIQQQARARHGKHPCGELVEAVRRLLARFADPRKDTPGADKTGVAVKWSRKKFGKVRFQFATQDGASVAAVFDATDATRENLENFVGHVLMDLDKYRRERQAQALPIYLPPSTGVN